MMINTEVVMKINEAERQERICRSTGFMEWSKYWELYANGLKKLVYSYPGTKLPTAPTNRHGDEPQVERVASHVRPTRYQNVGLHTGTGTMSHAALEAYLKNKKVEVEEVKEEGALFYDDDVPVYDDGF